MNICCSPAVEDPGKECDKDGGGEVDDRRKTTGPGICQLEIFRRTIMMMIMTMMMMMMMMIVSSVGLMIFDTHQDLRK